MDNKKDNGIFQITLNLTIASFISGLVLGSTYFITEPFAREQRIRQRDLTMRELVVSADRFVPLEGQAGWYSAEKNGVEIADIIPSEARGYGGIIKLLLAVDTNGETLGYKILSHNETPGLGDRAGLTNFSDQFKGKKIEGLEVVKNHQAGKIDAMTGATVTSRAVTKAVRKGLEEFGAYLKNGKRGRS